MVQGDHSAHLLCHICLTFTCPSRIRVNQIQVNKTTTKPPCTYELYFSRYALPGDSGVYECQISTEPKMSRLVRLSVAGKDTVLSLNSGISREKYEFYIPDTRVSISSGDDVHANTGSNVVFKCEIEGTMGKPAYVFW